MKKIEPLSWLARLFTRHRGFFVTGTDTGVGKTFVSCLLARELRLNGHSVGVMKPAESGANKDALLLKMAAGSSARLDQIRPYKLKAALAPGLAADLEGKKISLKRIGNIYRSLQKNSDGMLVEGAGGLMVPLSGKYLVSDLAKKLGLPLLIVARPGLGTINHCLLTLAEARRRGLRVAAVVLNGQGGRGDASIPGNPRAIARYGKVPVIGPLKWKIRSLKSVSMLFPPS